MVKKVFALASVTALTGVVVASSAAGCSSTTIVYTGDGGRDSGREARAPITDDSGSTSCAEQSPIDVTGLEVKPPRFLPGSCTEAAIAAIGKYVDDTANPTISGLKGALVAQSQVCADCVFGPDGDTWAPIVEESATSTIINIGGCLSIVATADLDTQKANECGEAFMRWDACLTFGCQECTTADRQGCYTEVAQGACLTATQRVSATCGDKFEDYYDTCNRETDKTIIDGAIRAQCIGSIAPQCAKDAAACGDGGVRDSGPDTGADGGQQ